MDTQPLGKPTLITDNKLDTKAHQPISYKSHVKTLCSNNPCLQNLASFLADPHTPAHGCRVAALDFTEGAPSPSIRADVKVRHLSQELHDDIQVHGNAKLQGRILVIEDLTAEVIELLGATLDIDPLFFSMHLHVVSRTGMRHQTPDQATLPSRLSAQNFTNMSYHRAFTYDNVSVDGGRLQRDTIIDRKLIFLPSTTIGLVQHCISVIRINSNKMRDFWLGETVNHNHCQSTDVDSSYTCRSAYQPQVLLRWPETRRKECSPPSITALSRPLRGLLASCIYIRHYLSRSHTAARDPAGRPSILLVTHRP